MSNNLLYIVRNADKGARFSKIIVSSDEELKLLTRPRSNGRAALCLFNHLLSSKENWLSAFTTLEVMAYVGIQEKAKRL